MNYYTTQLPHKKLGFLLLLSLLIACSSTPSKQQNTSPNIILIMADDLGYGDLSCYGNTAYKTPNIDYLAKNGVRFTDFHSNGVVCSPTRAALMTGRYQQRSGVEAVVTAANHRHKGLAHSEFTIPEYLKGQGYTTAMFGKWHLGYDTLYSPINQGFDQFKGFVSGNVDYHSHIDQAGYFDWWMNKDTLVEEGYTTDLFTQASLDFIEKNNPEKPFFLYLAHEAPHYPYQGRNDTADRTVYGKFPVQGSRKDRKNAYKEMVVSMDEGVGRIIQKLEEENILENTFIIFISDNGANNVGSNGKLKGYKGHVWEGGHRVPAIMYWKNKLSNQSIEATGISMDVFPTLIDIIDTKETNAPDIDGQSLYPSLVQGENTIERELHWRYKKEQAVRVGDWKLVRIKDTSYLYNLEKDLQEKQDVLADFPKKYKELDALMKKWNTEMDQYEYVSQ